MSEDSGHGGHDGHESEGGGGGGSKKPKPPSPLRAVALPAKREVAPGHMEGLIASGLVPETISLANLYTEHHHARLAELMQRRTWSRAQGGALVFPFYLPDAVEPHAYRVRPTIPRVVKQRNGREKPVKYDQASAHGLLVFFTPRARASGAYRAGDTLYWTEGEKKSLALDQLGYTCVGLTGVWNWIDAAHKDATHEQRLHPHLVKYVQIAGRVHVICFDADARRNDNVMLAAQRLAGVLRAAGAADVRFVVPPDDATKGIDDYFVAHGESATRALLATAAELEGIAPSQPLAKLRSLQALREAPLDDSLRMPEGYDIQRDGSLWASARDDKHGDSKVTHTPMFITRKLVDYQTADERCEVLFARGEGASGAWVTLQLSRKAVVDGRTLVAEAGAQGAPVTSNSAARVVDWLDAFENANPSLPRIACVSSGGWHTVEGVRFFAARTVITAEDEKVAVEIDTRGVRRTILAALTPHGSLEAHTAALQRAWFADPTCATMICAAFAATLLEPLRASNFAVHLVGESSRGKTSQLKIAASVFGDPNNAQWLASWSVTATGAELRAAVLCDLPQCYDEVGGGDPVAVERMVYALINGGGRTRAQRDLSMRETASWRTIVLSTGERELADEQTATGAQVRVVQLPVNGFGKLIAAEVDTLRDECAANSGQAGEEWLRHLVENGPDAWKALRAELGVATKALRADAKDPLQGRIATYFALLTVTEAMLAKVLGIGDPKGQTMRDMFANRAGRESVQGIAERARDLVEDWVVSEPDAFTELEMSSDGSFDAKSKGKTRHGFTRQGCVYLIPSEFRAFCVRNRLAPREVLREWQRLGWLYHDAGRVDKRVRVGAGLPRFVVLYPLAESQQSTGTP